MGIAGDDTWGAKTHDEFLLDKEKHHLRFSFKGSYNEIYICKTRKDTF